MDDLITWLRLQLDEDEQSLGGLDSTALNGIESTAGWDVRAYVERGLAEVEAKRRILELHPPFTDHAGRVRCEACAELCHSRSGLGCDDPADAMYPCETVEGIARLLAQPYAGRDGWREEWAA